MGNYTPNGNLHGAYSGSIFGVTGSVSGTVLVEANPERNGGVLYNGTDRNCYVAFGTRCSAGGVYTLMLPPSGTYTLQSPVYTGDIAGVWPIPPTTGTFQTTETV